MPCIVFFGLARKGINFLKIIFMFNPAKALKINAGEYGQF